MPDHGPATEHHPRILFPALPHNTEYKWLAWAGTYRRFYHSSTSCLQVSHEDGIMVMAPHHQGPGKRARGAQRMGKYQVMLSQII